MNKVKLIKKGDIYFLDELKVDGYFTIGNSLVKPNGTMYNLSIKNCQAIENGYYLDELAEEWIDKNGEKWSNNSNEVGDNYGSFKAGFQKALELMGDKKFSEDDMVKIAEYVRVASQSSPSVRTKYLLAEYQSLQQTEWDVEFNPDEFDANGCLILKRI